MGPDPQPRPEWFLQIQWEGSGYPSGLPSLSPITVMSCLCRGDKCTVYHFGAHYIKILNLFTRHYSWPESSELGMSSLGAVASIKYLFTVRVRTASILCSLFVCYCIELLLHNTSSFACSNFCMFLGQFCTNKYWQYVSDIWVTIVELSHCVIVLFS